MKLIKVLLSFALMVACFCITAEAKDTGPPGLSQDLVIQMDQSGMEIQTTSVADQWQITQMPINYQFISKAEVIAEPEIIVEPVKNATVREAVVMEVIKTLKNPFYKSEEANCNKCKCNLDGSNALYTYWKEPLNKHRI